MEIVEVRVKIDIFRKVSKFVFIVQVHACVVDVFVDDVDVFVCFPDAVEITQLGVEKSLLHFKYVGFLDDVSANKVEGVDFVRGRKDNSFAVLAVTASDSQGVEEHAFVAVDTQIAGSLDECGEWW